MTEVIRYIFDLMDISLVQTAAAIAVRLCLFAANIRIIKHLFDLICEALRRGRAARRSSPARPRIQARIGPVNYYTTNKYGVADNRYCFEYIKQNGAWRAYILYMPDLRGRQAAGGITHRLFDNGRPYICWNRDVLRLKDIKAISHVWADKIQKYIATGERFG